MNDGIYVELFAVKDGVRYNAKILDMKEMTMTLTAGLVDGIEKLWEKAKPVEEPEPKCQHNWRYEHTTYNYEKMCAVKLYRCVRCGETMTEMEDLNYEKTNSTIPYCLGASWLR